MPFHPNSTFLYGVLSERFGWNTMILVWLGIGAFGAIVCVVFAKFWGKKAALLDEGKI